MRSSRAAVLSAALVFLAACSDSHGGPPPTPHTVRIFAWGGGTTDPAPGVYTYDSGTVVTLTATPESGHVFTGWSGAASGYGTSTAITVDGDLLVGARFWSGTPGASTLPVPDTGPVVQPGGAAASLRVLSWGGFTAAVSYTFDDARVSQSYAADPGPTNYEVLSEPGVPMTFYVSPSEVAKAPAFWPQVYADGNEIGNHTEDHCNVDPAGVLTSCAYDYGAPNASQTAQQEVDLATQFIETTFGQPGVWTMASPYGDADWQAYAEAAGMIAHRGVYEGMVSPDDLDLQGNLPSDWFGPIVEPGQTSPWGELGDTAAVIESKIDAVRAGGAWTTFLFHRLTPAPDDPADGCCAVPAANIAASMEYLQSLGDVWGGTVVDVSAYRIGKDLVSHAVTSGAGTWTWTLPPNFPPGRYVRVTVDGGVLSQAGHPLVWDPHGYYEVALDAGELTLAAP